MTLFPIHAAGYHTKSPGQNVLDRVISSYAHTVKSLENARQKVKASLFNGTQKVLFITMPTTPGHIPLPYTKIETEAVARALPSSLTIEELEYPTKSAVIAKITQFSVVHFACHGTWALDPSNSFIYLADWKTNALSVGEIVKLKLNHAQFAYLSACHASNNRKLSLLDEEIHMAGAFQLAGFASVIGTLWQISDRYSRFVAEYVYGTMAAGGDLLDVQKAAYGLHCGLRDMREKTRLRGDETEPDDPMAWAPYKHIGA
jgi:CHAT domain-containing protein